MSPFSFLSLFLGECGQFCQFCLPLQRTSSWFYFFLFLSLFYLFPLWFYYFLPSDDLRFCLLFFSFFKWLFIWDFSFFLFFFFFLREDCIIMNFPLRTDFAASHRFCMAVFSLSFVSRYFLIFSLISSLTHWFFSSISFSHHIIIFSHLSFCSWFPVSCCGGQKKKCLT